MYIAKCSASNISNMIKCDKTILPLDTIRKAISTFRAVLHNLVYIKIS